MPVTGYSTCPEIKIVVSPDKMKNIITPGTFEDKYTMLDMLGR